jgi:phosphatidylinositol 4-kinase
MQCFTDLVVQVEEMESEPSVDTYTWETMSESLVIIFIFLFRMSGSLLHRN